MRVLGIDPGLTRCGLGIVSGAPGRELNLVHVEVVSTPPEHDLGARLADINDRITEVIAEFRPDHIALERVFSHHNVRTVMGTAQVSGVCILLAHQARLPLTLYTPTEVKAAVTGSGTAAKPQINTVVSKLLGIDRVPGPADAADALALAITDVWRGSAQRRLLAAQGGRR